MKLAELQRLVGGGIFFDLRADGVEHAGCDLCSEARDRNADSRKKHPLSGGGVT